MLLNKHFVFIMGCPRSGTTWLQSVVGAHPQVEHHQAQSGLGSGYHLHPVRETLIYLAVILDASTRAVRGWCLSRSLGKSLTISALQMALGAHPAPDVHHSDQGS